jgi:hypothetical protein
VVSAQRKLNRFAIDLWVAHQYPYDLAVLKFSIRPGEVIADMTDARNATTLT